MWDWWVIQQVYGQEEPDFLIPNANDSLDRFFGNTRMKFKHSEYDFLKLIHGIRLLFPTSSTLSKLYSFKKSWMLKKNESKENRECTNWWGVECGAMERPSKHWKKFVEEITKKYGTIITPSITAQTRRKTVRYYTQPHRTNTLCRYQST